MSADETIDKDFLEYVLRQILTLPDQIVITRTVDEMGVLLTLKVAKEDMGRIIGKDGKTAKAIRTLLRVIGSRNNMSINLKILEPEDDGMFQPETPEVEEPADMPEGSEQALTEENTPQEETPAEDAEPTDEGEEKQAE